LLHFAVYKIEGKFCGSGKVSAAFAVFFEPGMNKTKGCEMKVLMKAG